MSATIINIWMKFWKPIGNWKPIRHHSWNFFAPVNISGRGVPHPRPPVAYNCCVSVFQACNARIEPTTLQLIDVSFIYMCTPFIVNQACEHHHQPTYATVDL